MGGRGEGEHDEQDGWMSAITLQRKGKSGVRIPEKLISDRIVEGGASSMPLIKVQNHYWPL